MIEKSARLKYRTSIVCFWKDFWLMLVIIVGMGLWDTGEQIYDHDNPKLIIGGWVIRFVVIGAIYWSYHNGMERVWNAWIHHKKLK